MTRNRRSTLSDVARAAGVSPVTVSRAIRQPDMVSEALRQRVAEAVAELHYIPNTLADEEQFGMTLADAVSEITACLNGNDQAVPSDFVNLVMIDTHGAKYPYDLDLNRIRQMGIDILDVPLVTPWSFPYIDPDCFCQALVSLT